jgi:quercetin dioxygenase-like cupin family protein
MWRLNEDVGDTFVCYPSTEPSDLIGDMEKAAVIVLAGITIGAFAAHQPGIRRTDLQRHDLAIAGREVIQVRVELDPGVQFGQHWHPGDEIVYVLEGSLEYELDGQLPVTLHAGDVLFIPSAVGHSARNVGRVNGVELATYIVEKGKPLVVMTDELR